MKAVDLDPRRARVRLRPPTSTPGSVVERFGADIVVTRNICVNEQDELVLEAFTTMMGQQRDQSVQINVR